MGVFLLQMCQAFVNDLHGGAILRVNLPVYYYIGVKQELRSEDHMLLHQFLRALHHCGNECNSPVI